ncbi:MAG TPA: FeoA family protein [Aggregatilineaceae bacterium]|nr:FeoA family protein [Aggregatilineaceae bacterium]
MDTNRSFTTFSLADLQPGKSGTVADLHSKGLERRRMMDLGIVPGTTVVAEIRSPLGDPMAYRVRGALVALRREQAELVLLADPSNEGTR